MTDEKKSKTLIVRCPTCKKSTRYDQTNPFRPFCSAICKDHDIIAWAEEKFRVPAAPLEDEAETAPSAGRSPYPTEE